MIVTVNLSIFPGGLSGMDKEFLAAVFHIVVLKHPAHQFVFISSAGNEWGLAGDNVHWVKAGPAGGSILAWRYWYNIKLPALLKKQKASVLFSADYFFATSSVSQCIAGCSPDFLQHAGIFKRKYFGFYKKYIPLSLANATSIVVAGMEVKNKIAEHYGIVAEKIKQITPVPFLALNISNDQKEAVKNEYAGGKEYFLNTNSVSKKSNLLALLKAFSLLKKRQQTNMKLVLAGKPGDNFDSVKKDLTSYKYRDDVVLTGDIPVEKRNSLLTASYALVDTSLVEGFTSTLFNAFRAGIPVVCPFAEDGMPILRTAPDQITDIAAQMMLLYKDEGLRTQLVQQGKEYAARSSLEKSAESIWQCIEEAAGDRQKAGNH